MSDHEPVEYGPLCLVCVLLILLGIGVLTIAPGMMAEVAHKAGL